MTGSKKNSLSKLEAENTNGKFKIITPNEISRLFDSSSLNGNKLEEDEECELNEDECDEIEVEKETEKLNKTIFPEDKYSACM